MQNHKQLELHLIQQRLWSNRPFGPGSEWHLQMATSGQWLWAVPKVERPGLKRHLTVRTFPLEWSWTTTSAIWVARASWPGVLPYRNSCPPSGRPLPSSDHARDGMSGHSRPLLPRQLFFGPPLECSSSTSLIAVLQYRKRQVHHHCYILYFLLTTTQIKYLLLA